MPTRRQLIQKITLNANASSVTFSNIPQNYTDLKIVMSLRTDAPDTVRAFLLSLNSSSLNFTSKNFYGTGTSAGSSSNYITNGAGYTTGANATSNTFSSVEMYLPNYTSSQNKAWYSKSFTENNASEAHCIFFSGLWSNSSSISKIDLSPYSSANFLSNSSFYLYGITQVPIIRGGEVSIAGGYKIHTFKNTASLQVIEGGEVEYLVVAGGASGGYNVAGGGGAGGYRSSVSGASSGGGASAEPKLKVSPGSYTVTVGAGGASVSSQVNGINGSSSTLLTITSTGGGGGSSPNQGVASSGGSGGGGSTIYPAGASGTSGQGYSGGSDNTGNYAGGGGGGAGSSGNNGSGSGTSGVAGNGGSGVTSSITGSSIIRAGGGGGGAGASGSAQNPGTGGSGGGGNGGGPSGGATDGVINTGSGGGGGRWIGLSGSLSSGAGGSGIVIIRYPYDGN